MIDAQELIITIATCTVTMSLVALLFMELTKKLLKRYSAKCLYYTWVILIIGLIIPFRPQFDVGFLNIPISRPSQIISNDSQSNLYPPVNSIVNDSDILSSIPQNTMNKNINPYQIILGIWAIGIALTLLYYIVRHVRFVRVIKRWSSDINDNEINSIFKRLMSEMKIKKTIGLTFCDSISSPMLIGFFKPVVLLPNLNLKTDELEMVLRHELIHFKRKDLWYKAAIVLMVSIHWFNPIIYFVAKKIALLCEMSCDFEVLRTSTLDERAKYGNAIIELIKSSKRYTTVFSTNLYGGKNNMKTRIFSVMDINKKRFGTAVIAVAMLATLASGAVFANNTSSNDADVVPEIGTKGTYAKGTYGNDVSFEQGVSNYITEGGSATSGLIQTVIGFDMPIYDKSGVEHTLDMMLNYNLDDKNVQLTKAQKDEILKQVDINLRKIISKYDFDKLNNKAIVTTLQSEINEYVKNNKFKGVKLPIKIEQYSIDRKVLFNTIEQYPSGLSPQEIAKQNGMKYFKVDKKLEEMTDEVVDALYKEYNLTRKDYVMFDLSEGDNHMYMTFAPEDKISLSSTCGSNMNPEITAKVMLNSEILDVMSRDSINKGDVLDEIILDILSSKVYKDTEAEKKLLKNEIADAVASKLGIDKKYISIYTNGIGSDDSYDSVGGGVVSMVGDYVVMEDSSDALSNVIGNDFAQYQKYGLEYNKSEDNFYFKGELVSFFHDETSSRLFTKPTEGVRLVALININGELVGIDKANLQEIKSGAATRKV